MKDIKFKVKISKLGNFYFFLENLSGSSKWAKEKYNAEWLKLTGNLSLSEKRALKSFQAISNRIGQNVSPYTIFFQANEQSVWKKAKCFIQQKDYIELKRIFFVFRKRFEKIFSLAKPRETKSFEQYINSFQSYKLILKDLENFYSIQPQIKQICILLVLLPPTLQTSAGKYSIANKTILLETAPQNLNTFKSVGIILHELVHLCFENPHFENLINNHTDNLSLKFQVREIVNGSLLPEGYLAKKYFNKIHSKADVAKMSLLNKMSHQLIPFIKKYIDRGTKIDDKLIKKTLDLIKDQNKKAKN